MITRSSELRPQLKNDVTFFSEGVRTYPSGFGRFSSGTLSYFKGFEKYFFISEKSISKNLGGRVECQKICKIMDFGHIFEPKRVILLIERYKRFYYFRRYRKHSHFAFNTERVFGVSCCSLQQRKLFIVHRVYMHRVRMSKKEK